MGKKDHGQFIAKIYLFTYFKHTIQQSECGAKVPCRFQMVRHLPLQCSPTVLTETEGIGLEKILFIVRYNNKNKKSVLNGVAIFKQNFMSLTVYFILFHAFSQQQSWNVFICCNARCITVLILLKACFYHKNPQSSSSELCLNVVLYVLRAKHYKWNDTVVINILCIGVSERQGQEFSDFPLQKNPECAGQRLQKYFSIRQGWFVYEEGQRNFLGAKNSYSNLGNTN